MRRVADRTGADTAITPGADAYRRYLRSAAVTWALGSIVGIAMGTLFFWVSLSLTAVGWRLFAVALSFGAVFMVAVDAWVTLWYLRPVRQFVHASTPSWELGRAAYRRVCRLPLMAAVRSVGPHLLALLVPGVAIGLFLARHQAIGATPQEIILAAAATFPIACAHGIFEYLVGSRLIHPLVTLTRPYAGGERPVHVTALQRAIVVSFAIGVIPLAAMATTAYARFAGHSFDVSGFLLWASTLSGFGIVFAISAALLLAHSVTDPVAELLENMQLLAAGQPRQPLSEDHVDEFADVARGFNRMVDALDARLTQLHELSESLILTLGAALEVRDPYTSGHSERVARMSVATARAMGLSHEQCRALERGALLHDIGKIGVADTILRKTSALTPEEWAQMRRHPVVGAEILAQVKPQHSVVDLLPIIRHHHERVDGRGYPDGLAGDAIPLLARIVAVADAYDAMTSARPYRSGMPVEKVHAILQEGAGTQWDRRVVEAFLAQHRQPVLSSRTGLSAQQTAM